MLESENLSIIANEANYPENSNVCEYLYKVARAYSDKIAVRFKDEAMTFDVLNRKSNKLARVLRNNGVRENTFVALLMEHSIEMVIAIWGIIKAGGAYVPINTYDAPERQQYIIDNSDSQILLTNLDSNRRFIKATKILTLADVSYENNDDNLTVINCSDDLLYLIYTSGSTGKPKGVMVEHRNLLSLLKNSKFQYNVGSEDVWTLFHSYAFDFSVLEIFGSLLSGATLIILEKNSRENMKNLLNDLAYYKVTVLCLVPSVFYNLADLKIESMDLYLRYLILGGESLNMKKLENWHEAYPQLQIVNVYGITETTIINISNFITSKDIDENISNIGYPMPTCTVYLMEGDEICEIGNPGEICISGPAVSRGYLKMDELNKQKFVGAPFRIGKRMYRSGDLAVMLPDKRLKYIGRKDNQVKIRGFRIELEEIENSIRGIRGVSNIVVDTYKSGDNGDVRLIAYVSFLDKKSADKQLVQLKKALKSILPYYMNPSSWIIVEEIPITVNGKADREKLKEISFRREGFSSEYVPADTDIQLQITHYWEKLFEVEPIGIKDSFFELGGHSLLVIQLINFINENYSVELMFSDIIEQDTILEISNKIENYKQSINNNSIEICINKENRFEPFEMTDLQQAYYIGRQKNTHLGNCVTHIYSEYECVNYEHEKFIWVLNELIKRHDMLRCEFDDSGTQRIKENCEIKEIKYTDISEETEEKKKEDLYQIRKRMEEQFLDYRCAPLASVEVTKIDSNRYIIHLYLDALIADGWSHELLVSEADILYNDENFERKELGVSFKDYVTYKNTRKTTENYMAAEKFWKDKLNNMPGVPDIPLLNDPDLIKEVHCFQVKKDLSNEEWGRVEKAAEHMGVSTFIVSLVAFCKVLARYSKTQRFIINIPFADRMSIHEDMQSIVGMCSSFFLYDFENFKDEYMSDTVKRVQKKIWKLKEKSVFEGSEVVREAYRKIGSINDAMATIVFTSLIDVPYREKKHFKRRYVQTHTSQIWLDAVAFRDDSGVSFIWVCVENLLDYYTVNNMADCFINLLLELVQNENAWFERKHIDYPKSDLEIIASINNTNENMENKSINELLTNSFNRYKDNIALAGFDKIVQYKDLEKYSLNIMAHLISRGIGSGDGVAIVMEKDWKQVVAVISILYSGAFYMPLESELPSAGLEYCLKNAEVKTVITDKKNKEKLQNIKGIELIEIEHLLTEKLEDEYSMPVKTRLDDIFAVIHTSGSTGHPKGIFLKQRGLINSVQFTINKFNICDKDVFFALTNLCHDMSMFDIFGALFVGATIVVPEENSWKNPDMWVKLISEYGVTIWNSVPPIIEMLIENMRRIKDFQMPTLKNIILGGAFLSVGTAKTLKAIAPQSRLINVGGPTETTLWSIYHVVTDEDIARGLIPYGCAIANMKHYVLNDNLELCPIGVKGVISSVGVGVAKGYVQLPEEENKRFIQWYDNKRLYLTGDMGYFLPNGEICIIGRTDDQIKINGKRIELKGIENCISQYTNVRQCCVTTNRNGNFLIAYYVSEQEYDENYFKDILKNYLPLYMIPKYFIQMLKLPLSKNGKIDPKLLPELGEMTAHKDEVSPRDDLDRELVEKCKEVINCEYITIGDNFFLVGGDSLGLIKIVAYVREIYAIDLSIADMFNNPTLENWHDMILKKIIEEDLTETEK